MSCLAANRSADDPLLYATPNCHVKKGYPNTDGANNYRRTGSPLSSSHRACWEDEIESAPTQRSNGACLVTGRARRDQGLGEEGGARASVQYGPLESGGRAGALVLFLKKSLRVRTCAPWRVSFAQTSG